MDTDPTAMPNALLSNSDSEESSPISSTPSLAEINNNLLNMAFIQCYLQCVNSNQMQALLHQHLMAHVPNLNQTPMPETKIESAVEIESDSSDAGRQMRGVKRPYSEVDLNEAMLTGEMGTRRASATYGIPRSTLRNKMNKSRDTLIHFPKVNREHLNDQNFATECRDESQMPINNYPSNVENLFKIFNSIKSTQTQPSFIPSPILPSLNTPLNDMASSKPARGKRGQYRRYDKAELDRAVIAVKVEGMSVHRAGTIYGVPHSTLEYKVKDRSRKSQQLRLEAQQKKDLLNSNKCSISPSAETPSTSKISQ